MKCPQCQNDLKEVPRRSNSLNQYQYEASKAGDWFCETCPDNGRGKTGFCYFSDAEVEAHQNRQCDAAIRN